MRLELLKTFRIVAEQGSLAGAADILGRTPSAISMGLSQLETELGAPLFETDRKNRLTPLGERVLEESVRATDAYERSLDAIQRHATSLAGTVRIAAVPSATVSLLPRAIQAFRRNRSEVRLEIRDDDSQSVHHRVLGIVSARPGEATGGTRIHEDELGIVCASGGEIARTTGKASWALLQIEPFIANPLGRLVSHPAVAVLMERSQIEARNTSALISFVRAGLGATILPRSAVPADASDLCFIAPADPASRRELHVIRRDDARLSPAAAAFREVLVQTGG
jgi:DNA-binding transcriptional LysR family regulator